MEDTGSTTLPKKKEKKYVQGPKLKILPSQLERPAEPPVLLDLLDVRPRRTNQPNLNNTAACRSTFRRIGRQRKK